MTEAMPFLQKAILLSYAPRPFGPGSFLMSFYTETIFHAHHTSSSAMTVLMTFAYFL